LQTENIELAGEWDDENCRWGGWGDFQGKGQRREKCCAQCAKRKGIRTAQRDRLPVAASQPAVVQK